MAKNKQTVIEPVPGASWIPAGDLLERVNAVHGGMRNNPTYQDPLVGISLHQPEECRMFRDTTTSESNMNEETDKPIPPLNAKTADGKPYKRFADVEGEIRDVWRRPPSDWIPRKEKFKSETLVFLICKAGLNDDYIRGLLLAELNARTGRIVESEVKGLDDVVREEIGLEVEAKIFKLVWSNVNCAQAEFLEITFAEKVRDLTKDAVKHYKRSPMARREQLDVWTEAEAKGLYEVVELRNDPIDPRPNPEELLILREDEARREELYQRIQAAVEDPRHFQALYLFHGEDKSLSEIAAHFHTTIREIRHWKDTAMHQIRAALEIETEEKREALNKQRRARRAKRKRDSAQPKATIPTNSEPPSPTGLDLSHP